MTPYQRIHKISKITLGLAALGAFLSLTLMPPSSWAEKQDDKLIVGLVSAIEGTCEAQAEGETAWEKLAQKDDIYLGDTIRTKPNSKVKITFKDDSAVSLGADASLQLKQFDYVPEKDERVSTFALTQGKARAIVGRIFGSNSKFEIETPTAVAGVRGTYFMVWVLSPTVTKVFVLDGKVTVRNVKPDVKGEIVLTPGRTTTIEETAPPGPSERSSDKELQEGVTDTKAEGDIGGGTRVGSAGGTAIERLVNIHREFVQGKSSIDPTSTGTTTTTSAAKPLPPKSAVALPLKPPPPPTNR